MAVDEAVFKGSSRNSEIMTLRIYSWQPSAVSLGYGQNIANEIDPKQCDKYGIEIVRRITGGRAILHDDEITYSLVAPETHSALTSHSGVMLRKVNEALIRTLHQFGILGELEPNGFCGLGKEDVCFTATGRYEIIVNGKKLAGSAQRRSGGNVLQQGTILLGPGHKKLPLLMPPEKYERRKKIAQLLNTRTISVSELLNQMPTFREWTDCLSKSFLEEMDLDGYEGVLDEKEQNDVQVLLETKYCNPAWTYRKTSCHAR